ncbi:MAG TPA: MFS transporter [Rugosimonospora sp.]
MLRALFGFLTLFLAFAVRSHHVSAVLFGHRLAGAAALGVVAGGLGVGSFLATAIGTRLRIRRPVLLQAGVTVLTAAAGLFAAVHFNLLTVALFALIGSAATGLAKLAVDATIQERVPERVRATAFGRSETIFMIAWVIGGALGLIPFGGRVGITIAAVAMVLASVVGVVRVGALRKEKLRGAAHQDDDGQPGHDGYPPRNPDATIDLDADTETAPARPDRPRWRRMRSAKAERVRVARNRAGSAGAGSAGAGTAGAGTAGAGTAGAGSAGTADPGGDASPTAPGWSGNGRPPSEGGSGSGSGDRTSPVAHPTRVLPRDEDTEPGYHLYRPSGLPPQEDE